MAEENGPAEADNRSEGDGKADDGSNGSAVAWAAGLQDADNRALVEAKQWGDPDAAIKSYRELESHSKALLKRPGKDASEEDWSRFFDGLGRPKEPDGYQFKMPDGLADDFPYDQDAVKWFRETAHKAGLTPEQAQLLHDGWLDQVNGSFNSSREAEGARATRATEAIEAKWGGSDSEDYTRNSELARRALKGLDKAIEGDLMAQFKAGGLVAHDGAFLSGDLAFALAFLGEKLFTGDGGAEGDVISGEPNPFMKGEGENATQQSIVLREDPEKARRLIRAAGRDPAWYNLPP